MSRMRLENIFGQLNLYELLESLIPDFVLAFALFTSLTFAVLAKRFDHQRSAIAMSVSIGFALSIGLVWWEKTNNLSIKNLGPIAIGFAILVLSFIMYSSIKQIGGSWAGVGITVGACILIAKILKLNIPIDSDIIQTVTVVVLIIGLIAFLSHTNSTSSFHLSQRSVDIPQSRKTMANLFRDRHLSDNLTKATRKLRRQSVNLNEHPEKAGNIIVQLKRMLPAEGYLTERMAQLRAKAYQIRNGHIARLAETKYVFSKLPVSDKKKAAADMAASYNQLIGIDTRLERLDRSVAENEKHIRDLTAQAQQYAAKYDNQKLLSCLRAAEKLQKHNSRLFKIIAHTENKLTAIAKKIAHQSKQVNKK